MISRKATIHKIYQLIKPPRSDRYQSDREQNMKKIHWFTIVDDSNLSAGSCTITDQEVINQISKVLRLQKGEQVVVKSSIRVFEGTLDEISKSEITLVDVTELEPNIPAKVVSLFVCLPKKDKFELILEKCTEIGVTHFYPIVSDRTIKKSFNKERALKIIEEASEQSQRTDTPVLHKLQTLEEILKMHKPTVFDVDGTNIEAKEFGDIRDILTGPEGGFSTKETEMFKLHNLDIYKIGNTVLKTETAAIVLSGLSVLN